MSIRKLGFTLLLMCVYGNMANATQDYLVKLKPGAMHSFRVLQSLSTGDKKIEVLTEEWVRVQSTKDKNLSFNLQNNDWVEAIQPNYKIKILENFQLTDAQQRALASGILNTLAEGPTVDKSKDNPAIPSIPSTIPPISEDPLFSHQWGMIDIGVKDAWKITKGDPSMVVAVLDTGVDYTHPDLVPNLWRNSGEIGKDSQGRDMATNGVDDDNNGYIDDTIGWDFATNDNKPYDLAVEPLQLLMGGGNPGHGTHCAGNVAARGDNGVGIAGVAPNVRIMSLRFMDEKGQGTTAEAIKAIKYAVDNGAKVLSNSWGAEGEDASEADQNKALRDIIKYAEDHNVLFIAAAGNGHQGVGYDNDTDAKPGYPASYDNENIVSVAAIDVNNQLGAFSNWGFKTVDIGAPGVNVYSTTVGGLYSDKVIDLFGFEVSWDGTSMATPHVAGAAALYWSAHPEKNWNQVKEALLKSSIPVPALKGKVSSEGKLNVKSLMAY